MTQKGHHVKPTVRRGLAHRPPFTKQTQAESEAAKVLTELGFGTSYQMSGSVVDFAPRVKAALVTPMTEKDTRDFIWLCKQVGRFYYSGLFDNITSLKIGVRSVNHELTEEITTAALKGRPFFYKKFTNPETCNSFHIGFYYS